MLEIITDGKSILFKRGDDVTRKAVNTIGYNIVDTTVIFIYNGKNETIDSELLQNLQLNGETLTPDNADEKLKEALFFLDNADSGLTPEQEEKINAIVNDGDGTLYLSDDGTYKPVSGYGGTPGIDNLIWFDSRYTGDVEDGSEQRPFKTIQAALALAYTKTFGTIAIAPATSVSDINITKTVRFTTFPHVENGSYTYTLDNITVNQGVYLYADSAGISNLQLASGATSGGYVLSKSTLLSDSTVTKGYYFWEDCDFNAKVFTYNAATVDTTNDVIYIYKSRMVNVDINKAKFYIRDSWFEGTTAHPVPLTIRDTSGIYGMKYVINCFISSTYGTEPYIPFQKIDWSDSQTVIWNCHFNYKAIFGQNNWLSQNDQFFTFDSQTNFYKSVFTGDGTKFLSNDGSYKEVQSGGDLTSKQNKVINLTTDTAISVAAKVITATETVTSGDILAITYTNGNTANFPTVSINNAAPLQILLGGQTPYGTANSGAAYVVAGGTVLYLYDGTKLHQFGSNDSLDQDSTSVGNVYGAYISQLLVNPNSIATLTTANYPFVGMCEGGTIEKIVDTTTVTTPIERTFTTNKISLFDNIFFSLIGSSMAWTKGGIYNYYLWSRAALGLIYWKYSIGQYYDKSGVLQGNDITTDLASTPVYIGGVQDGKYFIPSEFSLTLRDTSLVYKRVMYFYSEGAGYLTEYQTVYKHIDEEWREITATDVYLSDSANTSPFQIVVLTQDEFTALSTKDENTLYFVKQ